MKKEIITLFLLVLLGVASQAQTTNRQRTYFTVEGMVVEQPTNVPIEQAAVRLLNAKDSTMFAGVVAGKDGAFLLKQVPRGSYLLTVSFMGYKTFYKPIEAKDRTSLTINVGRIGLFEDAILLKDAVVVAQAAEVVVKEDTTEYNAGAYKMQESAVIEDLLKRLPGVEVGADGKITIKGKEVKKIMIDGKELFKGDPSASTKNIPVDIIEKLQVIDDKSELAKLTGIDDGDEQTVINLQVKKGMKRGWVVNASAGAGVSTDGIIHPSTLTGEDAKYDVNTFATRILDDTNITIIANGNNINNRRGGGRISGGGSGGSQGINTSATLGVNVVKEQNSKLTWGGDLQVSLSDRNSYGRVYRENLLPNQSINNDYFTTFQRDTSQSRNYGDNAALNFSLRYKPNERATLEVKPTFTIGRSESESLSSKHTWAADADSTYVNRSVQNTTSRGTSLSAELEATYAQEFAKKGRKLSVSTTLSYTDNLSDGTNLSINEFFLKPGNNKHYNQESKVDNNNYSTRLFLSYVEPVGKNNFLQASYSIRYNSRDNLKITYEWDDQTQTYDSLNIDYSKSILNSSIEQQGSFSFRSVRDKLQWTLGLDVTPSFQKSLSYTQGGASDGKDSIWSYYAGRSVINFAPTGNFTYRFTKDRNLRVDYRGRSQQPSITQIDPTEDNTNPLNIQSGNPDLLPAFTHNLRIRFNNFAREKQQSFSAYLTANYIENAIINYSTFDPVTGIQRTAPINKSGTWNTTAYVMLNLPLGKKFQLNNFTQLGYTNNIGFTKVQSQSVENITRTTSVRESLGGSFRNDWLYMQLRANLDYSHANYTLEGKEALQTFNYGATYYLQLTLPKSWAVGSDITYNGSAGYSNGYSQEYTLWNAEVSKQFLKNDAGTLRLRVTDILQQQLSISRTYSTNYFQDQEYNTLQSYVMLSFAYRFNSMGNSSSKGGENRRSRGDQPPGGERSFRVMDGGRTRF